MGESKNDELALRGVWLHCTYNKHLSSPLFSSHLISSLLSSHLLTFSGVPSGVWWLSPAPVRWLPSAPQVIGNSSPLMPTFQCVKIFKYQCEDSMSLCVHISDPKLIH